MTVTSGPDQSDGLARTVTYEPFPGPRITAILPSQSILLVLLAGLLIVKIILVFAAPPTPDEAYYWLWGQHPALSYFDHPPMIGWSQGIAASIFGRNLFALRVMTLVTFAGSLWIVWFWTRRLTRKVDTFRAFLGATVVLMAVPMLMRFQSVAHPDHLLIFFGLLTLHFWAIFLFSIRSGTGSWTHYYFGCTALGMAGLSKYNAVLIGLGFAGWILLTPKGRTLLRSPHLWGGAFIALAMQAPVLLWNAIHGWPSFTYNLDERIGQSVYGGWGGNLIALGVSSVFMLSPALLPALFRFLTGRQLPLQTLGRAIFAASWLFFAVMSLRNTILYYWNLVAYLAFFPVAALYLGSRREFRLHAIFGIWMGACMILIYVFPGHKAFGAGIRDVDLSYGLAQIGDVVEEEEKRLGATMVATTDYRTAPLLSFSLRRLDIEKFGSQGDQFDLWFKPSRHEGASAIILVDSYSSERDLLRGLFNDVTTLREIKVRFMGIPVHDYQLIYASNMRQ